MKTFARGRALRLVGGVAGMAAGLLALSGCSEEHAADPQWTVLQQIDGPRGEDLPLRSGRADAESDGHGFGRRHIQEDQGYVPSAADMHTVLTQAPECREGLDPGGADTTCAAEIGGGRGSSLWRRPGSPPRAATTGPSGSSPPTTRGRAPRRRGSRPRPRAGRAW